MTQRHRFHIFCSPLDLTCLLFVASICYALLCYIYLLFSESYFKDHYLSVEVITDRVMILTIVHYQPRPHSIFLVIQFSFTCFTLVLYTLYIVIITIICVCVCDFDCDRYDRLSLLCVRTHSLC